MNQKILLFIPVFGILLAVGALQLTHGETPTPQPDDNSAMTITSFDASSKSGVVPIVVKFTASVQAGPDGLPPLRWSYDFGDGNVAEDMTSENVFKTSSISHTYSKPGTYSAMLTVTDQGFNTIRSQAIVITVGGSELMHDNSQISISEPVMVDSTGHAVTSFHVGQKIGIQSMLTNLEAHDQRFAYVVQAIHNHHMVEYYEGSSAMLQSNQSLTATQFWTPEEAGNYTVTAFAVDNLADRAILSDMPEETIAVQASGNSSAITTDSTLKSSASKIWFEYTPICCNGAPWEHDFPSKKSFPLFVTAEIKDYFNNSFGITILESMQTHEKCVGYCDNIHGKPLGYSYYFLVPSSDENNMLNLGYKEVDTIPSDVYTAGL